MSLLFDFTVDREKKTIFITREFSADLDLIWDAFTKAEILDQWTAPKPWRVQTKEMEFREGGRWLYAMVSPENVKGYSLVEFIKIHPKTDFYTKNTFSDENGNQVSEGYSMVNNSFKAKGETTTVYIEKKFDNLSTLEMIVKFGYKEGLTMGYANLDEYLRTVATAK
jgi:uncharacterized protein YndB with AHSA1/START domain